MAPRRVEVCSTLFIVVDGIRVGGKGLIEALKAVDSEGSIRAAARKLGISYKRLWARITRAEQLLGFKLLEAGARGSRLTPEARRLLQAYEEARRRLEACVEAL